MVGEKDAGSGAWTSCALKMSSAKQSILSLRRQVDCFASLAMTWIKLLRSSLLATWLDWFSRQGIIDIETPPGHSGGVMLMLRCRYDLSATATSSAAATTTTARIKHALIVAWIDVFHVLGRCIAVLPARTCGRRNIFGTIAAVPPHARFIANIECDVTRLRTARGKRVGAGRRHAAHGNESGHGSCR